MAYTFTLEQLVDAAKNKLIPRKPNPSTRNRLTPRQVASIRLKYKPGLGGELARKYGVTTAAIHHIITGRTHRKAGR